MTDTKTLLAIVNPAAGGGRCGKLAAIAVGGLRAAGVALDVRETRGPGDATRIAREAYRAGQRDFVAVGGDGTAHEVINGLFPEANTEGRVSVGFLPLGTGNSFLRDFHAKGRGFAQRALVEGAMRGCDVMRIEHGAGEVYSLNLASIGFVADVCARANRNFKGFGAAGYGLGVVTQLANMQCRAYPFRSDDGQRWDQAASFVSFNNSRFTGGSMMMAPTADTHDGLLDVTFAGALSRVDLLATFPKIFSGTHTNHPVVKTAKVKRVDFEIEGSTDVMIDGEVLNLALRAIEMLPDALDVRV